MRAAGERAQAAADQVANAMDGQRMVEQLRQLAADPMLRRFLQLRTDETQKAAHSRLSPLTATSVRTIELWDAARPIVLEVSGSTDLPHGPVRWFLVLVRFSSQTACCSPTL